MTVCFSGEITGGQCGIGRLYNFKDYDQLKARLKRDGYGDNTPEHFGYITVDSLTDFKNHKGGTGMFGTGFIPDAKCKEVYEALCAKFKCVLVTPVRENKNSGHPFFYAMFDDQENEDVIYITPPPWPFTVEDM
jgi:hypothetical protein